MILTNENFNDTINSDKLTMVDFWANWCMPCKMLMPVVQEIEDKYSNEIIVGKVNVDDYEDIAVKYNVFSIPTLIFFKNGEIIDKQTGLCPKTKIEEIIENNK